MAAMDLLGLHSVTSSICLLLGGNLPRYILCDLRHRSLVALLGQLLLIVLLLLLKLELSTLCRSPKGRDRVYLPGSIWSTVTHCGRIGVCSGRHNRRWWKIQGRWSSLGL